MLVFSIGVALFFVGQHNFLPLNIDRDTELVIRGGMAYPAVETLLVSSGVLKNPMIFRAFMILGRKDAEIRFGRYIVKKGMSAASLIELLTSDSGPIEDVEITNPEGFTISEIAGRLEEYQIVDTVEFLTAAVNNEEYRNFWMLDGLSLGESLEGYLFPDTYRVKPGNPETMVQSILAAMQQQL
jgi:UPF0755 protein